MTPKLHVFQNEHDWMIAESPEDATAAWNEWTGANLDDYDPDPWVQLPDDGELMMISESWKGAPEGSEAKKLKRPKHRYYPHDGYWRIIARNEDWVQAIGRGLLGSTEW